MMFQKIRGNAIEMLRLLLCSALTLLISSFCIAILFFLCSTAFAGQPVFDATNYERAFEILKEGKRQTEQLISIQREMSDMKNTIGYFKGDANSLKNDLLNWKSYYDKIDSLDSDNFSAFSWLGLDSLSSNRYAPNTSNTISGSFKSDKAFNDVKLKMFDDEKHPEEMKYRRQELAHKSMTASVVVSNESKNTLSDAKQQIYKATEQSLSSKDLYDATVTQNKLLGIIASELVQQRELQAQQLEMIASFFARFEGTSRLTEPYKRSTAKRPWE